MHSGNAASCLNSVAFLVKLFTPDHRFIGVIKLLGLFDFGKVQIGSNSYHRFIFSHDGVKEVLSSHLQSILNILLEGEHIDRQQVFIVRFITFIKDNTV